ncbi:hypothetical protein ACFPN2_22745 [Steroidobacter flavus]|uniref:Lipoprotein n=1 Tax=Steroidobacter flavus TaxID=1842136 RepID=A0ABV8SZ55_9GAMM
MHLKRLLPILVLGSAGCATNYLPPQAPPPPLWDGESGFRVDAHSLRVNEGVKRPGDVIVEHDAQLKRTGLVLETVRLRNPYGVEMIIPEGAKAFATNFTLTTGPRRVAQEINPIEWCAFLPRGINDKKPGPQSVCIFWENEQRARYTESEVGEFAFQPGLPPTGMPGPVPKIEEAPVDFDLDFTRRLRIGAIGADTVTLELTVTDGTASSYPSRETYNWKPDGTFIYLLGDDAIVLTRSADRQTVDVRLRDPEPVAISPNVTEYTVVLELLVGTHGLVKEARVLQSSGLAHVDALAVNRAENDLKLEPFMENGRRVEKRGRFPVKVRVEK